MSFIVAIARRPLTWAYLLLVASAVLTMARPASAHVAHPDEVRLFAGTEGPYQMEVWAVPYVGYLHVTVVFEPQAAGPLSYEPRVTIAARSEAAEADSELGPVTAQREAFSETNDYWATLDAQAEGAWTVQVDIASEVGEASLALPVTLRPAGGIPLSAIVTGLGLLIPIVWLLWGAIRDRRKAGRAMRGNRQRKTAKGPS